MIRRRTRRWAQVVLVGMGALAAVACQAVSPLRDTAPTCRFYESWTEDLTAGSSGQAQPLQKLIQHASGRSSVVVEVPGHVVLDRPLSPDRDGSGVSGRLLCDLAEPYRVTASEGSTRLSRDFPRPSDRVVVLIDLGGKTLTAVDEDDLLLD